MKKIKHHQICKLDEHHHQIWCEKETRKDFSWQMLRAFCVGHVVFGADFFFWCQFCVKKFIDFFDGIWRFHWTKPREGQSYKRCYWHHHPLMDSRWAVSSFGDPWNWSIFLFWELTASCLGAQWFWSISHLYKALGPGITNVFIPSRKEVVDHLQWERFFFPKSLPKFFWTQNWLELPKRKDDHGIIYFVEIFRSEILFLDPFFHKGRRGIFMLAFQGRAAAPKVDLRRRVFEIAAELSFFWWKSVQLCPGQAFRMALNPHSLPAKRVVEKQKTWSSLNTKNFEMKNHKTNHKTQWGQVNLKYQINMWLRSGGFKQKWEDVMM